MLVILDLLLICSFAAAKRNCEAPKEGYKFIYPLLLDGIEGGNSDDTVIGMTPDECLRECEQNEKCVGWSLGSRLYSDEHWMYWW